MLRARNTSRVFVPSPFPLHREATRVDERPTLLNRGCGVGGEDRGVVRYETREKSRDIKGEEKFSDNGTTDSNIEVWLICALGAKIIKAQVDVHRRCFANPAKGVSRI